MSMQHSFWSWSQQQLPGRIIPIPVMRMTLALIHDVIIYHTKNEGSNEGDNNDDHDFFK